MLQLVLGRAGSGKTHYMRHMAKQLTEQNTEKIMLLVPEQYSFESEKAMLRLLGPAQAGCVEVTSFTRLTDTAFRAYGGSGIPKLEESGRSIFMSLALEEVKEELEFYVARPEELIPLMLSVSTELKMCAVPPARLLETAQETEDEKLRQKLREVGLILSAYDALVAQSYLDPLDDLQRLKQIFSQHHFFAGYHIYIDSFKGFTQQEFDLIELMLSQAGQVTVALTCDTLDHEAGAEVFSRVRHTANVLTRLARRNHVAVSAPVMLTDGVRFAQTDLDRLEQQVFRVEKQPFSHTPDGIGLFSGETVYSEAAYIGAAIRHLVMNEGYAYRDFAIIARNLDPYRGVLDTALERYEVPYFMDTPRSVYAEPLMCMVLYALQILKSGFSSDNVFVYLKTGLAGLTPCEISMLENYTFLWKISGKKWLTEWTANVDGFVERQTEAQQKQLAELNRLREKAVKPLVRLQKRLKDGSGQVCAKALYQFLEEMETPSALQALSDKLEKMGRPDTARQQVQLWNILMEILDQCASGLAEEVLTVQRFAELLRLMILSCDVAGIPQSLDHVTVGTADRMRPAQPKVVFVIGAVQGEFPAVPNSGGIFSDPERQSLIAMGLPLSDTAAEAAIEERYLAYAALTGASHRLYITWHRAGLTGEAKTPSAIVQEVKGVFPLLEVQTEAQMEKAYFACTAEAAFSVAAKEYRGQTPLYAALKEMFAQKEGYAERWQALERAGETTAYRFAKPEYAKKLFRDQMSVSATQIEQYHLCPFQYFCRYGLNLRERRPAEMDQMEYGSLIHYLIQQMFEAHSAKEIAAMEKTVLTGAVQKEIAAYVNMKMGGSEDKTERFRFVFRRIADSACVVIAHIARELSQSKFRPVGHEMALKAQGGDFPPLAISLQDGTVVRVEGKIDRTDVMEENGVQYVRVVDYKTGKKEFKIGDILHGVNMQMLIYLAALVQSGRYRPAGVLYMPASRPIISVSRSAKPDAVEREINKQLRMNGVIVNDASVICGMEEQAQGLYIPVVLKDGVPRSQESLLNADEMQKVLEYVQLLIGRMAKNLQQGHVQANPLQGAYDGCQYCPYFAVCRHEKEDGGNLQYCCKKDEVLEQIKQQEGESADEQDMDAGAEERH